MRMGGLLRPAGALQLELLEQDRRCDDGGRDARAAGSARGPRGMTMTKAPGSPSSLGSRKRLLTYSSSPLATMSRRLRTDTSRKPRPRTSSSRPSSTWTLYARIGLVSRGWDDPPLHHHEDARRARWIGPRDGRIVEHGDQKAVVEPGVHGHADQLLLELLGAQPAVGPNEEVAGLGRRGAVCPGSPMAVGLRDFPARAGETSAASAGTPPSISVTGWARNALIVHGRNRPSAIRPRRLPGSGRRRRRNALGSTRRFNRLARPPGCIVAIIAPMRSSSNSGGR